MINFDTKTVLKNFYSNNKSIINSIVIYGAFLIVSKKFGVKIPGLTTYAQEPESESRKQDAINDYKVMPNPKNSTQEAIVAIWRTGVSSSAWEATKENSVNRIVSLVSSVKDLDDDTLRFAIIAAEKISQSASWQATKTYITDAILKLSRLETVKNKEEPDHD